MDYSKLKLSAMLMSVAWTVGSFPLAQAQAIEEITVTAQKRSESLQEVPVSVTAVTASAIEDNFVVNVTDVGFLAPNVQLQPVSTFPGFANFVIRGIGVSSNSIRTLDPAVNIVQDGVPFASQIGAVVDVFDVEAVEILRGPQGIFFGRNSTGGAVLLRTAKPNEEGGKKVKVAVGSDGLLQLEGVVEGAIGDDGWSGKLAVQHRSRDGLFKDRNGGSFVPTLYNPSGLQPANSQVDQAKQDSILIKPTFTYRPNDDFDITLFTQYYKDEGGGSSTRAYADPASPPSTTERLFGYTPPSDPYEINHDLVGVSNTESWHAIVEANWALGDGQLSTITGYRELTFDSSLDVDGTPFPLIHFPDNEELADQFTQEIRYSGALSEAVDYMVGGFFMDSKMAVTERREFSGVTAGRVHALTNYIESVWVQEQQSIGVFANVNYHVNDALTISAGLRYTDEEKKLNISPLTMCTGPGFSGCVKQVFDIEDSWGNLSPRVALDYKLGKDLFAFATWSRGFRSGNFNARAATIETISAVEPERADQFEFGFKGEFLDNSLRTNVAIFTTDYTDIQRVSNGVDAAGQPLQRLRNAADATINGLELEFIWVPSDNLSFDGNFGYIDAQFDSFDGIDANRDGVIDAADQSAVSELVFDHVPDYNLTVGANLSFNVGSLPGDLTIRTQYAYRDDFANDTFSTPNRMEDGFGIWDLSLRYETKETRIALYGRNIGGKKYADIRSPAFNLQAFGGQPTNYGVEFSYYFQ